MNKEKVFDSRLENPDGQTTTLQYDTDERISHEPVDALQDG